MQCTCAVIYCHLLPVWLYSIFPYYHITGAIFGEKLLNTKCVFWFSLQLLSETFLILRRTQRDIIINVRRYSCKVPVIVVRFSRNLNFLDRFSKKKIQISNFMKIRPVRTELVHSDGRRDGHNEANCHFSTFANAPKKAFNLIKPTGHVMHQQFNIQQLYALPTLYLCVLYLSENKQRLVPLTA